MGAHPMNLASFLLGPSCCALLLLASTGCKVNPFANLGTGTHLDAPTNHPHDPNPTRERPMVVEVTTDADGNVASITFQRSSGKEGIDGYVAETIRQNWPRQPSMRTVASLSYSTEKGFSTPKILSSTPLG